MWSLSLEGISLMPVDRGYLWKQNKNDKIINTNSNLWCDSCVFDGGMSLALRLNSVN